jgi:hypothetical protein
VESGGKVVDSSCRVGMTCSGFRLPAGLDGAHSPPRAVLFRVIASSCFFHGIDIL